MGMCEIESRQIDLSAITVIYGGGRLLGAFYKGFWLTITREDCDMDEDGVYNNSKLSAEYHEIEAQPMRLRRTGFVPISPYAIGFEDIAKWLDEEFKL